MRKSTRIRAGIILLLVNMFVVLNSFSQDPPLVYDVENTGAAYAEPPLPDIDDLPVVKPLPDPFEWADGSGRDTTFASWEHRRNEIKAQIQHYEIGLKPDRPDTITATLSGDTLLTVNVTKNGETLTLVSNIYLPDTVGPFPAVIGMVFVPGFGSTGSLPDSIFTKRNIASIEFVHNQVTTYGGQSLDDPYFKLYPDQDIYNSGQYSAWSWGVSRLIDGLELVQDSLPIDLEHLAVTGCSYAGKMALFAGAFDERVALTIAQESGGGGAPAWRVSETLDGVENLGSTDRNWFRDDMFDFSGNNVSKLPHDHHELMAMCAPRALLVTGNTDNEWLANPSCYVSAAATKKVYNTFGIGDRFGYYIDGGHAHCAIPASQLPAIEAFVDKFLLGDTLVNTDITVQPYQNLYIPEYWTAWWGTGDPKFGVLDRGESEEVWYEAECATVGAAWNVRLDTAASNGGYVIPKPGLENLNNSPADSGSVIYFPFTVNTDTTFYVFGRVWSSLDPAYDSYWMQLDGGSFRAVYDLETDGWEWREFRSFNLTAGDHTIGIGFREQGVKLDKICISDFKYLPGEKGEPAEFTCEPDTTTIPYNPVSGLNEVNVSGGYILGQNYPNPLSGNTTIAFEIPRGTYVSIKVYSMTGKEISELAGKEYIAGKHTVEFDARNLSDGIYFYKLQTDDYSVSRKMIVQTE